MSDRPTPETNALISVGLENADRECVPADIARKLERERDEWAKLCGQYKQERDEAREELENEMKWHHQTHKELVEAQCKLLDIEYDKLKS
jgi:hypothetical protein